jgi:hypothetical protein
MIRQWKGKLKPILFAPGEPAAHPPAGASVFAAVIASRSVQFVVDVSAVVVTVMVFACATRTVPGISENANKINNTHIVRAIMA